MAKTFIRSSLELTTVLALMFSPVIWMLVR